MNKKILQDAELLWKKFYKTRIIGRTYYLDMGSIPVAVKPVLVKDGYITVEYLNSTPGRKEQFTASEFMAFSGIKIDHQGIIL
jgi:hypothetical protein